MAFPPVAVIQLEHPRPICQRSARPAWNLRPRRDAGCTQDFCGTPITHKTRGAFFHRIFLQKFGASFIPLRTTASEEEPWRAARRATLCRRSFDLAAQHLVDGDNGADDVVQLAD